LSDQAKRINLVVMLAIGEGHKLCAKIRATISPQPARTSLEAPCDRAPAASNAPGESQFTNGARFADLLVKNCQD